MIRFRGREIDTITRDWIRNASDEHAAAHGCVFDGERGEFAINWMEHYLRLYEGEFAGQPFECRDWQRECFMRMFSWIRLDDEWSRVKGKDTCIRRFSQAVIFIPKKNKKALAITTPIPTPTGWTFMEDLKAGDVILDEFRQPTRVLMVSPISVPDVCFKITFIDRVDNVKTCPIVADGEHLWTTLSGVLTTSYMAHLMQSRAPLLLNERFSVASIERVAGVPVCCIGVDSPTQQFLAGDHCVPTHNSPSLAALGLYLTCGDGELGGKTFFFAKDGAQAREIAGKHSIEMLKQSDALMSECSINNSTFQVTHEPTRSILRPESSGDARSQESKEGLNGNILVDELHVVDRRLMNRVSRAGISRMEPFQIEVSTAGNNPDSYGKTRAEYARDVIDGKIIDQRLFGYIAEAPQDTTDEQIDSDPIAFGKMANPAWGHTIREAEFLADWQSSKLAGKSEIANFKMYRLNIWQQSSNPLLDVPKWNGCRASYVLNDLKGMGGGLGIDLSRTEDMSACVFAVPGEEELTYWLWPLIWMTRDYATKNNHLASFLNWAAAGDLRLVERSAITDDDILPALKQAIDVIRPTMACYDETYAASLAVKLEEATSLTMAAFRQGHLSYSNPTLELRNAVRDCRIKHPGNQVLTWQATHVMGNERGGLIKPIKDDKARHKKIDAIQAAIMGIHACLNRPQQKRSVYEDSGPDERAQNVVFYEA